MSRNGTRAGSHPAGEPIAAGLTCGPADVHLAGLFRGGIYRADLRTSGWTISPDLGEGNGAAGICFDGLGRLFTSGAYSGPRGQGFRRASGAREAEVLKLGGTARGGFSVIF
jgi:hypothetical protein